jgi:hypothetical protein
MSNVSFNIDVFVNIVKRKEALLYRSSVVGSAANIGYVSGQELSPDVSLSISDRSTSLAANRAIEANYTTITGTKYFSIVTENFVVTDVFVRPTNTITSVPLFYAHTMSLVNVPRVGLGSNTLATGVKIVDAQILDIAFQPLKVTELLIDTSTGVVYNNLESYFKAANNYNCYYVKYTVNDNGSIHTFVELLDNTPVYRIATFNDLDSDLQIIVDGRKVYLLDETDTGFDVTLPIVNTYAYKLLSSSRIQVLPPVANQPEDPWYVRISNGKFYSTSGALTNKYYIAEFNTQTFWPEPPFKKASLEGALVLSSTIIKVDQYNIAEDDTLDMGITMQISDISGNAVAAFTTLDIYVGQIANNGKVYQKWTQLSPIGIRSLDRKTGLLDIEGLALNSSWDVTIDYYYTETNYVFSLINFNPVSNKDALTTKTVIFIDPDSSTITKDQTIYYLTADQSGRVIASNWPNFNNTTQKTIINDRYLYYGLKPSWQTGYGSWEDFIDVYTAEGSGAFLILADVTVAVGASAKDLTIIDSRYRGGGIREEKYNEVLAAHPEVAWCWDIGCWDGLPFPGNATFLVEVPATVLEGAGGTLTEQEVKDIVKRHVAAGVYPVIRAYGDETTVSGLMAQGNMPSMVWIGHGY